MFSKERLHEHGEIALSTRKKREAVGDEITYKATEPERVALKKQLDRLAVLPPAPRLTVRNNGTKKVFELDHPKLVVGRGLLMEALGTADFDFYKGVMSQIIKAASHNGEVNEEEINFMLSVIKGIAPQDQLEAMLALQMAVIHITVMSFAPHFSLIETLPQQDSAERALNKLTRTFTTQLEAIKRYRTGGEQKVTVQHVSVGEGGQAIVGNVTQAQPETAPKKSADKRLALTEARQPAIPVIEKRERAPVPSRRKQRDDEQSST